MAQKTNKKLKGAKKCAKELKEELEAQEQRIAELEYKNEAQLEISRLLMETALIALRDGADIKEFFPLPSFAAYKFIVETKFDEYNKSQPTLKEVTDEHPEFSDGSSTKEFLLQVYQEVFDFEVNNIGELGSHHETMLSCEEMHNDYLKWKELKLQGEMKC